MQVQNGKFDMRQHDRLKRQMQNVGREKNYESFLVKLVLF